MRNRFRHAEMDDDDIDSWDDVALEDDDAPPPAPRKRGKSQRARKQRRPADLDEADDELADVIARKEREKRKVRISEGFKCRHCKAFIGIPPTGGSQRNHCPMCLYSLHVDGRTPGDRASDCQSLMAPIGVFYRPNLEQVLVHECLGCGQVRFNRIAADDNPVLLAELPVVDPPDLD